MVPQRSGAVADFLALIALELRRNVIVVVRVPMRGVVVLVQEDFAARTASERCAGGRVVNFVVVLVMALVSEHFAALFALDVKLACVVAFVRGESRPQRVHFTADVAGKAVVRFLVDLLVAAQVAAFVQFAANRAVNDGLSVVGAVREKVASRAERFVARQAFQAVYAHFVAFHGLRPAKKKFSVSVARPSSFVSSFVCGDLELNYNKTAVAMFGTILRHPGESQVSYTS